MEYVDLKSGVMGWPDRPTVFYWTTFQGVKSELSRDYDRVLADGKARAAEHGTYLCDCSDKGLYFRPLGLAA